MIDEMMRLIAVVHQGYADCYSKNEEKILRKITPCTPALEAAEMNIKERR